MGIKEVFQCFCRHKLIVIMWKTLMLLIFVANCFNVESSCTQPNEVYDECPAPCPPQRCDVDLSVAFCDPPPKPGDPGCEPGCRCVDGYVRNSEALCVTKDQCQCGGDPNAEPGCGTNCGRLCSNYKKKGVACPLACQEGGCECKKGYVLDDNTRKCVLPEDCSESGAKDIIRHNLDNNRFKCL